MFIIGKYVKIRFKNRRSACYFLSCRGQKIKNITKIIQKGLLLFTFLVSFFIGFLSQKLIYAINIWLNVVFGLFFEQDHLLNLLISGVYAKDGLNVHVFQYKNWRSPKPDRWFFLYLWLSEDLYIRKSFKWKKKYGSTGLISEKSEVLCEELNERAEAATGSYYVRGDSFQFIDSVPVTKNHRNIWLK